MSKVKIRCPEGHTITVTDWPFSDEEADRWSRMECDQCPGGDPRIELLGDPASWRDDELNEFRHRAEPAMIDPRKILNPAGRVAVRREDLERLRAERDEALRLLGEAADQIGSLLSVFDAGHARRKAARTTMDRARRLQAAKEAGRG